MFRQKKKETVEERSARRKEILTEYFNSEVGKKVFAIVIKAAEKEDETACPLHRPCPHWFAKYHDKAFPNFFVNPCWEMSGCLCPLRKDGCDNCSRKINGNPLC